MGRFKKDRPTTVFCQYIEKSVDKCSTLCYYIGALREMPQKANMGEWWNW